MRHVKKSATLACQLAVIARRNAGLPVYNGGLGANPLPAPKFVLDALNDRSNLKEYTQVEGMDPLKAAILEYHTTDIYKPKDTIVGNGLKEILFTAQMAFNGTTVLMAPYWLSYKEQVDSLGAKSVTIPHYLEEGFRLDIPRMRAIMDEYVANEDDAAADSDLPNKMIIWNNPNNPTGKVHGRTEVEQLAQVCEDYNMLVFADEIYGNLIHSAPPNFQGGRSGIPSISEVIPHRTMVGSSLSKDMACGGLRCGWLTFPEEAMPLHAAMSALGSSVFSCASHPIQYAAKQTFTHRGEFDSFCQLNNRVWGRVGHKIREIFEGHIVGDDADADGDSRAYLTAEKKASADQLLVSSPESAWYIMLEFGHCPAYLKRHNITDSYELCEHLASTLGVVTVPGQEFGSSSTCVRFSYIDVDVVGDWDSLTETLGVEGVDLTRDILDDEHIDEHASRVYKALTLVRDDVNQ